MRVAYELGWVSVVINHRGAQSHKMTTTRPTTWGDTSFLEDTIAHFQMMYPTLPVLLCGFSMGANVVLKFMGTTNENPESKLHHSVSGAFLFSYGFFIR